MKVGINKVLICNHTHYYLECWYFMLVLPSWMTHYFKTYASIAKSKYCLQELLKLLHSFTNIL